MTVSVGKGATTTVFTTSAAGLVPAGSGGSTSTQFLRKDGTWAVPAGGGGGSLSDGDYGDVIVSSSGTVWSLDYTAVNATVAPVWANITSKPAAVTALSGTNTGDQTSIVGITGTLAQFNAALTGADFATGGGTATGTNTGDQTFAAADITDSGATGRALVQAVTPGGARTILGVDASRSPILCWVI